MCHNQHQNGNDDSNVIMITYSRTNMLSSSLEISNEDLSSKYSVRYDNVRKFACGYSHIDTYCQVNDLLPPNIRVYEDNNIFGYNLFIH